jgi:hypothetical protein
MSDGIRLSQATRQRLAVIRDMRLVEAEDEARRGDFAATRWAHNYAADVKLLLDLFYRLDARYARLRETEATP